MMIILLFIATGMFYPFLSVLCSIYLGGYFVWLQKKNRKTICLNAIDMALILLTACYFLSAIWAVDKGMALMGACKWLSMVWLCLILKKWDKQQQALMVTLIPWFAAGTVLLSALMYVTPAKDVFFIAGRLAGPFGYANSYAMFLLLGVGILLAKETKFDFKTISLLAILLGGILWTASRTVGLLTLVLLTYYVGKMMICRKQMRRNVIAILAVLSILAVGSMIPQIRGLYQRITDISLHSSTMIGRLLYAQDALTLIRRFPFGLGASGYGYVNGLTATGLYEVRYVHQALLQWILDIGIVLTILVLVILAYGIRKAHLRKNPYLLILILAVLHALTDIDMEYMAIPMILVILLQTQSRDEGRELSGKMERYGQIMLSVVTLFSVPMMIANVFYLTGNYEGALAVDPLYTDARELRMAESDRLEVIQQDAYTLVKNNPYSAKGCQMMGALAYLEGDYEEMQRYLDRELELVPYQNDEYEMYEQFLLDIQNQNIDKETAMQCEAKLQEIENLKQSMLMRMSAFGKQIADQPEFNRKGGDAE